MALIDDLIRQFPELLKQGSPQRQQLPVGAGLGVRVVPGAPIQQGNLGSNFFGGFGGTIDALTGNSRFNSLEEAIQALFPLKQAAPVTGDQQLPINLPQNQLLGDGFTGRIEGAPGFGPLIPSQQGFPNTGAQQLPLDSQQDQFGAIPGAPLGVPGQTGTPVIQDRGQFNQPVAGIRAFSGAGENQNMKKLLEQLFGQQGNQGATGIRDAGFNNLRF